MAPFAVNTSGFVLIFPNANGTEKFKARARMAEDRHERDRLFKEMSKIWPSFLEYQTRTDRLIPVVVLERQH